MGVPASMESLIADAVAARLQPQIDALREEVEALFPREGGYSVAVWPDGRLRLRAGVTLDARGEEEVRRARRGNPSRHPPGSLRIPVLLSAQAARRRAR